MVFFKMAIYFWGLGDILVEIMIQRVLRYSHKECNGGFTGRFSIEPEIIVAIPSELSKKLSNRSWLFPIDPRFNSKLLRINENCNCRFSWTYWD